MTICPLSFLLDLLSFFTLLGWSEKLPLTASRSCTASLDLC